MKILPEKKLAIKNAIIKAIENGQNAAKLSEHFGVSKSSIYKFRRILREQGFIAKDENDNFIVTDVKFYKQTSDASSIKVEEKSKIEEVLEILTPKESQDDKAMENRLQDKITQMRDSSVTQKEEKGIINKIFGFFKQ